MNNFDKVYGIPADKLSLDARLSDAEMKTITNKMDMISACQRATRSLEQITYRARRTPVLDDARHADLVNQFAELVKSVERLTSETANFGII